MTNQKEIHIKLFNLVKGNNTEKFKRELLAAEEEGFDFFHTEIDDPYALECIDLCDSFAAQMVKYKGDVSEEINRIFLDEIIVSDNDVQKLCEVISERVLLTDFNGNFLKLCFDYIKNKKFSIQKNTLTTIFRNFINIISSFNDRGGGTRSEDTRNSIERIEEVVLSLTLLFPEQEVDEKRSAFFRNKNEILKIIKDTPSAPPEPSIPDDDSAKDDSLNKFPGISTRGWIIIATCAVIGATISAAALYLFALSALGAVGAIATGIIAGAAVGGGVGWLTNLVVDKCFGEKQTQTA